MQLSEVNAAFATFMCNPAGESVYCAGSRVPPARRLHAKRDLAAMLLIDRIQSGDPNKPRTAVKYADRDTIYFSVDIDQFIANVTEEDIHDLVCYGVRFDPDMGLLLMSVVAPGSSLPHR